jgi:hypothetical protein
MAGENRIIAFGSGEASANQTGSYDAGAETPGVAKEARMQAEEIDSWASDDAEREGERNTAWIIPALAFIAIAAWTGLYIAANLSQLRQGIAMPYVPGMIAEWCVPVLLIGIVWLLALRHSVREAKRFGDVARMLSTESAHLEQRLTTVNRELSLAREFVASQSRDLETLGRVAADRLSQNAHRLEELVRDNGARVDSISTVSSTALENMEKLRGQLPVIASSAKDVTNNIANAGRMASTQLDEMVQGLGRLNDSGKASEQQVASLRARVSDTLAEFENRCAQLESIAGARFDALGHRSEEFRVQLDKHEVEVLAAIRTRAEALSSEIDATRVQLDDHEAQSLVSLRARLAALRDESEVVSRALRLTEDRASDALRQSLEALRSDQIAAADAIEAAQQTAVDGLAGRLATLAAEAERLDRELSERGDKLAMEAEERQARQVEQERHAIARIEHMLGELDGTIAERMERHRRHTATLEERAEAVTAKLEQFDTRLGEIARQTGTSEASITSSLETLTERLTSARGTLAATDNDLEKLTDDSMRLLELIQASTKQTHSALPEALAISEDRMQRLETAMSNLVEALRRSAEGGQHLASDIRQSDDHLNALVVRLREAQDAISRQGRDHADQLADIRNVISDIDSSTERAAARAGDELSKAIESLRGSLTQAVAAIENDSTIRISAVAETLAEESGKAIDKAMRSKVAEVSGQLEQSVAHAAGVTREAAMQMRDQLARVDELVANLESRVSHARHRAEEQVDNDFTRRVALITESLNSNAIDIARAMSSDVSDTAWASYLRGDRGIFTRRAVSLLENSETKAIQQLFDRDDAFREHVSRYIHDFEAMLRQILSTRDGNAMGVTILSSDMGKLYVALAQGIERLRG